MKPQTIIEPKINQNRRYNTMLNDSLLEIYANNGSEAFREAINLMAKCCKVKPSAVWQWRKGITVPQVHQIPEISAITGLSIEALTLDFAKVKTLLKAEKAAA